MRSQIFTFKNLHHTHTVHISRHLNIGICMLWFVYKLTQMQYTQSQVLIWFWLFNVKQVEKVDGGTGSDTVEGREMELVAENGRGGRMIQQSKHTGWHSKSRAQENKVKQNNKHKEQKLEFQSPTNITTTVDD